MKHSASTTNWFWFFRITLMYFWKLPFSVFIWTHTSSTDIVNLLKRSKRERAYTLLIIALDLLSIISPVILKFMKKKAKINTTTHKQFALVLKMFSWEYPKNELKFSRIIGIAKDKKAIICTIFKIKETLRSIFLLPNTEKERIIYCSNEAKNIWTRKQSPIAMVLSNTFSTSSLSMFVNYC